MVSPNTLVTSVGSMLSDWTGVPFEELGDDDNLIELGLDSLRMMRLASALHRGGAHVHFAELARTPTIGAWRSLISSRMHEASTTRQVQDVTKVSATSSEFELALMQHAYWIGRGEEHVLGGVAAHFYNEFDGAALDPTRLERALRALFARHAQLRIAVSDAGRQRVLARSPWPGLRIHDLRECDEASRAQALQALRHELSHRQLRIAEGEVFDVQLSLLPAGRTRLHLNLDMIAADALSLRILLADLAVLYRSDGHTEALAPLQYDYAAYLEARRAAPERKRAHARDAEWWRERLPSLPPAPALPIRAHARAVGPSLVVRRHAWLDAERKTRLFAHAQRRGVTPAMALCAAFCDVLGQFSADPEFMINVPLFDRLALHPQVGRMVGDFTGSILLAANVRGADSFTTRARRLQARFHEDAAHAEYSGVEVLRDLSRRAGGERVLAPVVFTSALSLGELFAPEVRETFGQPAWIISQGPQVWLDAQVTELDGGLLANWDALERAFEEGVLDAMFAAFTQRLDVLADDEAAWDTPLRPRLALETQRVRERVNATDAPRRGVLLHEPFLDHAREAPDAVAVACGDQVLSYGELYRRACCVAGALARLGAAPGEFVGICLPSGLAQPVAVLATLMTGAAYVPIDIEQPRSRQRRIVERAKPVAVLVGDEAATFDGVGTQVCRLDTAQAAAPLANRAYVDESSPAYVLFTSGSTGEPKGVVVPHRAAANTLEDLVDRFALSAADRTLNLSSLAFDLSVFDLFAAWWCGGAVVMVAAEERRDAGAWLRRMRQHRVSVLNCVPSALRMVLDTGADARAEALAALRVVLLGGDWVGVDLARRLADVRPDCRFVGLGGTTETAIHSTQHELRGGAADDAFVPYGVPLRNVRCRVVDEQGEDRPDWVHGELWIGGLGVADGYLHDPARTAERFLEREGRRWYRTGDGARYRPDGVLEFLGRRDQQVKLRGHRIELGEIEAALGKAAGVGQAVASIVAAEGGGQGIAVALTLARFPERERLLAGSDAADEPARDLAQEEVVAEALERVLARVGDDVVEPFLAVAVAWRQWLDRRHGEAALVKAPHLAPLREGLAARSERLADVLRGRVDALTLLEDSLLAPEAALAMLSGFEEAVTHVARRIDAAPAGSRPLRVAVLGARSGLIALRLAERVAREDVHYTLLDESPTLLARARQRLAGRACELRALERAVVPDDLLGAFDRVVAIGTLHAYPELRTGLSQAALLLAAGGELLAVEQQTLSPLGLIAAMLPARGFVELDPARRAARNPLVSRDVWSRQFAEAGFAVVEGETLTHEPRWLLCAEAPALSAAAVREQVMRRATQELPAYMVPSRIAFVPQLPLSANGKLDRGMVRAWLERMERPAARPAYELPVSASERAVAAVWSELLGAAEIGRRDHFFALGGDSLLGTRMLQRLRERGFQAQIAPLFTHPVLMDYARTLESAGPVRALAVEPRPGQTHVPFAPTDVQRAYCIGRMSELALGGVGAHYYSEFDGADVDLARLTQAFRVLIARHPALRLVFDETADQRVLEAVPEFVIDVVEVEHGADVEGALASLRETMSHQVFSPSRWPLFDVRAVVYERAGEHRTRLGIGLDNLIVDGLSMMTLYTELALLYGDPQRELAPIALTFRDYLTQVVPDAGKLEQARAYWRGRVDELPPAPSLPLVLDPDTLKAPRFTRQLASVPEGSWSALKLRARDHGVTPAALLLTAYADVLGTFSEQTDLTVQLTLFDRREVHPDIHRVLGDFTSLLPASHTPRPGDGWLTRVRRMQAQLWQDLDHREVSGIWIMRELARRRGESHAQLPVVFTSALGVDQGVSLDPGSGFPEQVWGVSQTPQAWLDLQVYERRDGSLALHWDAIEALFPSGLVAQMANAFLELTAALGRQSWELPRPALLPAAQRALRGRIPADDLPAPTRTLHAFFFEHARREPTAPALMFEGRVYTRGALAEHALRIAGRLEAQGVGAGALVAVSLPKGPRQIAAVFGVLATGAAYVPVGVDQPARRRERMFTLAGVACVVDEAFVSAAADGPATTRIGGHADARAYVIFTSGSTGDPKGVVITHRAAMTTIEAICARFAIDAHDRVLGVSALDFDLSVFDLFGVLGKGGVLVLPRDDERRDAQRLRDLTLACAVTVWNSVPVLLEMMLTVCRNDALPALRLSLVSGDWVPLTLPAQHASVAPGARLIALGGATEAAIWSNYFDATDGAPAGWPSVPYGTPLASQRFRVVNELGEDCPDWVPGELWIGGAGVAEGYVGEPERTAERFPSIDGARWYRTGDRGRYRPDGLLEFLGRRDGQLKIRGHRTELGEIDAALSSQPGVLRAVTIPIGERAHVRLTAFVVGDEVGSADGDTLRQALRAHLPEHAIPDVIERLPELPLTANGKVDRAALVRRAAARSSGPQAPVVEASEREQRMAALWSELLGGTPVQRGDHFFMRGGDSLLATRLIARLEAAGIAARLSALFAHPVLADFVTTLEPGAAPTARAELAAPGGPHEPFSCTEVQRAYLVGRSPELPLGGVGSHYYQEQDEPNCDLAQLESAVRVLIERHPMLRAVFDAEGRQRVLRELPRWNLPIVDLRGRGRDDAERELARMRAELSHRVADPTRWPLFELRAVRFDHEGCERTRIMVSLDNLIVDGLSMLIFFSELAALRTGAPLAPPPALGFRDYLTRVAPEPRERERAIAYWTEKLEQVAPAPALPLVRDPAGLMPSRFRRRLTHLPRATWSRLADRARAEGITPSVLLLSVYAEALAAHSARSSLSIQLTLLDRQPVHEDIDRVVGDFTSLLLFTHHPIGGETLKQRLQRTQQQLGRDLEHRAVSSVWVVRQLFARRGPAAAMPVVFTSALGLDDGRARALAVPDWSVSQTPQVWLDHQVMEDERGLRMSWDFVEALFPPGLVDAIVQRQQDMLAQLADESWDRLAPWPIAGEVTAAVPAAPRTRVLQQDEAVSSWLASLWDELLSPAGALGEDSGFFALGGDSLLATRMIERVRVHFGSEIKLRDFLADPTLGRLVELVQRMREGDGQCWEEGEL